MNPDLEAEPLRRALHHQVRHAPQLLCTLRLPQDTYHEFTEAGCVNSMGPEDLEPWLVRCALELTQAAADGGASPLHDSDAAHGMR